VGSEAAKPPAQAPWAGDPKELYRKAVGLMAETKFEEAATALTSAIAQSPAFTNAYVARGGAHLGLRRFDEAAADYRKAIGLDATLATPLFGLGRALERLGDRAGSCENYRRYLASSGRDVQPKLLEQARQAYARCTEAPEGDAGTP
jgi:tetratricopeptide (TPR) repeat protein